MNWNVVGVHLFIQLAKVSFTKDMDWHVHANFWTTYITLGK